MNESGPHWVCRELVAADQEFLWDIFYVALWDPPTEERRPRSVLEIPRIRAHVEGWGREGDVGLVLMERDSGPAVGAVWTRLQQVEPDIEHGCIFPEIGIAISEGHQGRGGGSYLMAEFITRMRPMVPGLRLRVHPANATAIRMYEKFGFMEYATGAGGYPQMALDFSKVGK